jgi:hypothetical protein
MHEPDRLRSRAAARPGDAGDGNREIGGRVRQRTLRHRFGSLPAHGTVGYERRRRHAKHLLLRFIGVGDEATVHHSG